jgi:crotonobetaine/carnitine-CoA ligase
MLLHQVNDADARLAIVHGRHLAHWETLAGEIRGLETIAVYPDLDPPDRLGAFWELIPFPALRHDDPAPLPAVVHYTDPMAIFYTSGTTGPSKGVIYSYAQAYATALPIARLCDPDDIFYMYMPMFHVGLSQMFGFVAIAGLTMGIREKFSVHNFWPDVRRYDPDFDHAELSREPAAGPARPGSQPPENDHHPAAAGSEGVQRALRV